ncbi:MAG: T9SS type A sorting domain-containing protein [bacterium]
MKTQLLKSFILMMLLPLSLLAQTNQWGVQYATFDDENNGTGDRTASVAVLGPNAFVALVSTNNDNANIFTDFDDNYLVGYMEADSAAGRLQAQAYSPSGQFDNWESQLDQVALIGAWQIAGGKNNYVYVANNDPFHNILVFELTPLGVISTDFRMETGQENIFAIDVDTTGHVYVVDYEGTDAKSNEVKVYAPIGTAGTTWGDFGGHNDAPVATIDLPPGIYQGVAASGNGTAVFVSSRNDRRILKFVGDPAGGYTQDSSFDAAISPTDIEFDEDGIEIGSTAFLGMDYLDEPGILFAAVDLFLCIGTTVDRCGGYVTGRIFAIDPATGTSVDTIDVAQWNLDVTGFYNAGSNNGRAGGFTSVYDVEVSSEPAVYSQTFYGWAIEKWIFDGDLGLIVGVEQIAETVPEAFALHQNYPNPFNPGTAIEFDLQRSGYVRLLVFNTRGQKVATLVDEPFTPGSYKIGFDASRLPNGIYYYTLEAGSFRTTKKMILIK